MPARYTEHLAAMRGGMARLWGRSNSAIDGRPDRLIEPPRPIVGE
jgi:hypothetical protein